MYYDFTGSYCSQCSEDNIFKIKITRCVFCVICKTCGRIDYLDLQKFEDCYLKIVLLRSSDTDKLHCAFMCLLFMNNITWINNEQ